MTSGVRHAPRAAAVRNKSSGHRHDGKYCQGVNGMQILGEPAGFIAKGESGVKYGRRAEVKCFSARRSPPEAPAMVRGGEGHDTTTRTAAGGGEGEGGGDSCSRRLRAAERGPIRQFHSAVRYAVQ